MPGWYQIVPPAMPKGEHRIGILSAMPITSPRLRSCLSSARPPRPPLSPALLRAPRLGSSVAAGRRRGGGGWGKTRRRREGAAPRRGEGAAPMAEEAVIIGHNGAGKSNLMDDITFVLGDRSSAARGSGTSSTPSTTMTRRIYRLPGNGAEVHFTRSITGGGHAGAGSEYHIDGCLVTWKDSDARLRSLGILIKACNFLVFEVHVESIASRNPKELVALLEQMSGSYDLKREYGEMEVQKRRAKERSALVYHEKKTIFNERKLKVEKEAEEHLRLQQDLTLGSCEMKLGCN